MAAGAGRLSGRRAPREPRAVLPVTLACMKPFSIVLKEGHPFGLLAGVALPGTPDPVPADVLERLHPEERSHALTLRGFSQVSWVGGRLAAAAASRLLGVRPAPVLTDPRGAPIPASDTLLSISHKRGLAVALAARPNQGSIGLDLEDLSPSRLTVASKVLTPDELATVQRLPELHQWTAVLLRFSLKESIYKALAPRLCRYIDFEEAEVDPRPDGTARVQLHLRGDTLPVHIEGRYLWMRDQILTMVRVRWS